MLVVFVIVKFKCAILSHLTELINVTKQSYDRLRNIPSHTILEKTVNESYESVFFDLLLMLLYQLHQNLLDPKKVVEIY